MLWLKFIHIAALVIWVAGLLYLPAMLIRHGRVEDAQDFARMRMASRFAYLRLISPAALLAVGAGIGLLFVADVLVGAHIQCGYILVHLADETATAPGLRLKVVVGLVLGSAITILLLVLAKPAFSVAVLPNWMTEPGLLNRPETSPPTPLRPAALLPHRS
jgi:putative membrane protein